jgi:hypothetical protein
VTAIDPWPDDSSKDGTSRDNYVQIIAQFYVCVL